MRRIDLYIRAGGQLDPNTWAMMDAEQHETLAELGDSMRDRQAEMIGKAVASAFVDSLGIDPDSMAQQVTELMAAEVKA